MKDIVNRNIKPIIYICFGLLIFVLHIHMGYISDDMVNINSHTGISFMDLVGIYWESNGRFFTDVLANLLYRIPMALWKLGDTLVYIIMARIIVKVFTRDTKEDVIVVCAIMLMYPFSYLASAGYIATSANYIYPIFAILLALYALHCLKEEKKYAILYVVLSTVPILYASNHDQSAVVFSIGCMALLIYRFFKRDALDTANYRKINIAILYQFIICIFGYLLYFTSYGHQNRVDQLDGPFSIADYADWTLFDKLYTGYTSTVSELIFGFVAIYFVMCLFIFILGQMQKSKPIKIVCAVPLGFCVLEAATGYSYFVYTNDEMFHLTNLISPYHGWSGLLGLVISLVVIASIFISVQFIFRENKTRLIVTLLLILGCGSRGMMGLSATLYASSFRTFTMLLFTLIICTILMAIELLNKKNQKVTGSVFSVIALAALYSYSLSYIFTLS